MDLGSAKFVEATPAAPRRSWIALLVSLAVVALVEQPQWQRGPLPAEVLGPLALPWPWWPWARIGIAGAAACLTIVLALACRPIRRRAGLFGVTAAAAVSAALAALALGALPPPVVWLVCALLVPLTAALAGVMREQGLVRLTIVSLVVGCAVAAARRQAIEQRRLAVEFAAWRDPVLQVGSQQVVVTAPSTTTLQFRRALAVSLRPPFHSETIDLAAVATGDVEAELLAVAGWQGVKFEAGRATHVPATLRKDPPSPFEVAVRYDHRGPRVFVVPSEGRFRLRVVTPLGVVRQDCDGSERGFWLSGPALEQYQQLVAGLPHALVLVRVEYVELAGSSPWVEVRAGG